MTIAGLLFAVWYFGREYSGAATTTSDTAGALGTCLIPDVANADVSMLAIANFPMLAI